MSDQPIKILLIEDNPGDARLMQEMLAEAEGTQFTAEWADRLSTGLERLSQGGIDVILLDLTLPDSSGLDSFLKVHGQAPGVPVVVQTGLADEALAVRSVQAGAQDYLVKGQVDSNLLVRAMRYAIERHKMFMELEQTRRQQLRMKDQFLSHVSHEVRTPLTAIYQFVTILLDGLAGDLNSEQRDYLGIILSNTKQLQGMIGELLEVTRSDTGKLAIDLRCVSVGELISETLGTLLSTATAKGVALSSDVPSTIPFVYADPQRLKQVLANLIENGVKFTPAKGNITVRARVFEKDRGFVCVAVADTGRGISPEGTQKIFERLYQEPDTSEASRKGLGLGLHICRELVTRHGGRIWVESELGKGSVFYITLPTFSLGKLLYPVIVEKDQLKSSIALIAVELFPVNGATPTKVTEAMRIEAWNVLQRCVVPGKNILLPRMTSTEEGEIFFLVEGSDQTSAGTAAQHIREQLGDCKDLQDPNIGVTVSTTMVETTLNQTNTALEKLVEYVSARIVGLTKTAISKRVKEVKIDSSGVMSHEVKTAFSVVLGYTALLRDKQLGELNPKQEGALGKIMDHANDLIAMVNNVLGAHSIKTGAAGVENGQVHLAGLLGELKSAYQVPSTKAIAINWDYPPELPMVMTDSSKLRMILQNLINNAVKFTEKGDVTISARYHPEAEAVEFMVRDTGAGIPREAIPGIFERARQLQISGGKPSGGVGMGLFIVQAFADLLGAKVEAESEHGKGSVFKVTMPVRASIEERMN